ncbi:hypothetical protein IPG36_07825 [bacterium]|nr:MAG: hypothetical protein IPG36_07825 [bacterium]
MGNTTTTIKLPGKKNKIKLVLEGMTVREALVAAASALGVDFNVDSHVAVADGVPVEDVDETVGPVTAIDATTRAKLG